MPTWHSARREGADAAIKRQLDLLTKEITISGTTIKAPSTAVTVEMKITRGSQSQTGKNTFHELLVDGQWRFTVSDGDAYKNGKCP